MLLLDHPRYKEAGDRELVEAVIRGDEFAGDAFVERFIHYAYDVADKRGLSPADADDVVQIVFMRLWEDQCRRLKMWRAESGFRHYLAPIVRHAVGDFVKERGRLIPAGIGTPDDDPPADLALEAPVQPDEALIRRERREAVREAIAALSPRDREVLLDLLRGDSIPAIAQRLGIGVNAAHQALHAAKLRLKSRLLRHFPGLFGGAYD